MEIGTTIIIKQHVTRLVISIDINKRVNYRIHGIRLSARARARVCLCAESFAQDTC